LDWWEMPHKFSLRWLPGELFRKWLPGGVGMGYAQHAGMVVVADGTPEAAERVLTTDPGIGILRHVDACYEKAIQVAKEKRVKIPMLK